MTPSDSQKLESYVPVYDVIPDKWEDARAFLVEQLKKISTAVNTREIGFFLDEELLSGKSFIPSTSQMAAGGTSQQFRTILRKVVVFPGLVVGANTQPHGIMVDANFTLIQLFGAATNAVALTGEPIPNAGDTISYTATDIVITVAAAYTRAIAVIEYIQGGPQAGNKGYAPSQQDLQEPVKGEVPTLADQESTAQSYKEYIPPTEQQERADANENFQKNPARYNYDFNEALKERKAITARNQEIQKSYQGQEATAVAKEEKVKAALKAEVEKLGLKDVPPKSYQKFEENVLNDIKSKRDGGKGLTQEQAVKANSKQLEEADRDFKDLGSLSGWSPRDFNRQVNALQKNFANRGDQQQMRDQLISDYGVSPWYASHRAYPIKKDDMPTLNRLGIQVGTPNRGGVSFNEVNDGTYANLKKEMGDKGSPLSVAYELDQRGEDPRAWLNYLNKHKDDLKGWQIEELSKNTNIINLMDLWLGSFEGAK